MFRRFKVLRNFDLAMAYSVQFVSKVARMSKSLSVEHLLDPKNLSIPLSLMLMHLLILRDCRKFKWGDSASAYMILLLSRVQLMSSYSRGWAFSDIRNSLMLTSSISHPFRLSFLTFLRYFEFCMAIKLDFRGESLIMMVLMLQQYCDSNNEGRSFSDELLRFNVVIFRSIQEEANSEREFLPTSSFLLRKKMNLFGRQICFSPSGVMFLQFLISKSMSLQQLVEFSLNAISDLLLISVPDRSRWVNVLKFLDLKYFIRLPSSIFVHSSILRRCNLGSIRLSDRETRVAV